MTAPGTGSPPARSRWRTLAAIVAVIAVLTVSARVLAGRVRGSKVAVATADSVTSVEVVTVASADSGVQMEFPGTSEALLEAAINARTDGYVKARYADIGQRVKQGALLAELERPELEGDLGAARANEEQARAALNLAQTTYDRWKDLAAANAVAKQELDERYAALQQRQADVAAATAQVERLNSIKRFQRVTAPFSGVITERNVEVGDLIVSGNARPPLFRIAQTDTLRIQVQVPQGSAIDIHKGQVADILLPESRGAAIEAKVARTASALDPQSRTLLTELQAPNKDGQLLPGTYVRVRFRLSGDAARIVIPANTLLFGSDGPRVLVVEEGHLKARPVVIGRDFGVQVEIASGLEGGEVLVINPTVSLQEGQQVKEITRAAGSGK